MNHVAEIVPDLLKIIVWCKFFLSLNKKEKLNNLSSIFEKVQVFFIYVDFSKN